MANVGGAGRPMELTIAERRVRGQGAQSSWQRVRGTVLWYLIVTLVSLFFLGPFVWALSSSLKTAPELYVFPPTLLPKSPQFGNYTRLWDQLPFATFTINSVIIGAINTVGQTVSAAAVAYGFARFRFPGRDL